MSDKKARRYQRLTYWSPMLGCEAERISMVDARGQEFFMIIPADTPGKALREARAKAIEAITAAIETGLSAGEVRLL